MKPLVFISTRKARPYQGVRVRVGVKVRVRVRVRVGVGDHVDEEGAPLLVDDEVSK